MLDWQHLMTQANADGEFGLHARFWNSTIKLGFGDEDYRMDIRDGHVTAIEPWFGTMAGNLTISGSTEDWDALLARTPQPFYQDLHAASVHHGFETSGDTTHYCAYYPAIRRLVELMREVNNG
jgi:hypothetical protein